MRRYRKVVFSALFLGIAFIAGLLNCRAQPFPISLQPDGCIYWTNSVSAPCEFKVDKASSLHGAEWITVTNAVITNRSGLVSIPQPADQPAFYRVRAMSTLGNGLVAYYPLDGNAEDISGNNLHGFAVGVSATSNRFLHATSALAFRNDPGLGVTASGYITLPISADLTLTNAFSIAAWFRTMDYRGRHVIAKQYGSQKHDSWAMWYETDRRLTFFVDAADSGGCYLSTALPPLGEWQHAVATWDGFTASLFVNNILAGSAPFSGPIRYDSNPVYIGADDNDGDDLADEGWAGEIDEVRIYNRALNTTEINEIYNLPW